MLTVVVPAYNEEQRLPATLKSLDEFLRSRGTPFEILVVDDGSRDGTAACVGPGFRCVELPRNLGKGGAVRAGMLAARGDRILLTDADLSTPMSCLGPLEQAMDGGAPVVIGSRRLAESRILVPQPAFRAFAGHIFTQIARTVLGVAVADFTCGFKLFRADAARDIFGSAKLNRWAYDAEVLFLARRRGWRIAQVPVVWSNSAATRVRLRRDVLSTLHELWMIRFNEWRGRYRP